MTERADCLKGVTLLVLLTLGVLASEQARASEIQGEILTEGTYAIGKVIAEYEAPEQVDGKRKAASKYDHLETKHTIPVKLGVSWGFEYRLTGLSRAYRTKIEMRATHPPLVDTTGKLRTVSKAGYKTTGRDGVMKSQFIVRHSTPEERIAGTWTLEIFANDEKVLSRRFELVAP